MDSVHTDVSTQPHLDCVSAPCIVTLNTYETPVGTSLCTSSFYLPTPLPYERFCFPFISIAPALSWSRVATMYSTMRALTPVYFTSHIQVSPLNAFYLHIIPSPTTLCSLTVFTRQNSTPEQALQGIFRPVSLLSDFAMERRARHLHTAESSSFSYGLMFRFRLLSTPHHCDAVTFNYRVYGTTLTWTLTMLIKHPHGRTVPTLERGNEPKFTSKSKSTMAFPPMSEPLNFGRWSVRADRGRKGF